MEYLILAIVWCGCGVWCMNIAKQKNRDPVVWFLMGVLFAFIAVIVVYAVSPVDHKARSIPWNNP